MATAVTVVPVAMAVPVGMADMSAMVDMADMSAMVDMVEAGAASRLVLPLELLPAVCFQHLITLVLGTTVAEMA